MMVYKEESGLVELIVAMNKSQRLFLSRKWSHSPYSNYLYVQLYFVLVNNKGSDYKSIRNSIASIHPSQRANVQKELYTKILNQLKTLQKETPFDVYRSMLKNYSILKGMNLSKQAEKWRAKAMVYKESNGILSEAVLVDEESYYHEIVADAEEKDQYMFSHEVQPFTASLKREYLYLRKFYLTKRFSKDITEYRQIETQTKGVLCDIKYVDLSLYDKIVYTRILYQYHYIQRDFVLAYKYATTLIHIYKKEKLDSYYEEVYLKLLNYQLLCLFRLNASEKYKSVIEEFNAIVMRPSLQNINLLRVIHFKYMLTHTLNWYIINGNFAGAILELESRRAYMAEHSRQLDAAFINGTNYKAACAYFGSGDHHKCIQYLDKIIFAKATTGRTDLQIFARILKLTALFELREDAYIYENIRSVYGYLARNKQLNAFQKEIMNFLRICARLPEANVKNELHNLRDALYIVAQDKFEQRPFFYFDVISWLDSKLSNKTISEVIGERGLGHRVLYER
jgi:hypothetical protein